MPPFSDVPKRGTLRAPDWCNPLSYMGGCWITDWVRDEFGAALKDLIGSGVRNVDDRQSSVLRRLIGCQMHRAGAEHDRLSAPLLHVFARTEHHSQGDVKQAGIVIGERIRWMRSLAIGMIAAGAIAIRLT